MSNNVFDKIGDIKNNVNRSTFDWSHDNNFTTGLGRIIPVFCELCPPNSALRIKPEFGLQFMPMMFPVQTKMKSYLSFYRVPLRTLWKDYMNFISSPQDSAYEPPYINFPADAFGVGGALGISSLADYFGVPVTSSQLGAYAPSMDDNYRDSDNFQSDGIWNQFRILSGAIAGVASNSALPAAPTQTATMDAGIWLDTDATFMDSNGNVNIETILGVPASSIQPNTVISRNIRVVMRFHGNYAAAYYNRIRTKHTAMRMGCVVSTTQRSVPSGILPDDDTLISRVEPTSYTLTGILNPVLEVVFDIPASFVFTETEISNGGVNANDWTFKTRLTWQAEYSTTFFKDDGGTEFKPADVRLSLKSDYTSAENVGEIAMMSVAVATVPINAQTCPYTYQGADASHSIKLSAYPFRAYEAIYNAYTRNTRNNPFMVDGKPVYNRWITNNDGGADTTTPLFLRRANWASDMFVTALTAPQQGQAPLVGITTYTEQAALENGHVETKVRTALVDEDGNKYAVNFESNDEELKGVTYTQLNADTPVRPVSNLYDLVTSGISINDFRNVNAYQRYLELNQFRGFKYKDIVEGRFDVQIRYDELDMPEYLGGITRDVIVNPVTQTVETSDSGTYQGALGSQSGLAGVRGSTDQTITCFCDEESLVIGLLSVVPMPIYTQVLPKHFLYRERLDSYNPEFDHIGYQPIGLSELCPVLDYVTNGKNSNATFGYQRPWYEYCQKLDSAHGLFRTQLRNFLINRVFDSIPQLGAEFTTIDEADVNNVFSVTETTDKIYGQIHFDATAKLPISRVVVPKLE